MKFRVIPAIALLITGCTTAAQNTPAASYFSYQDVRFAATDQTFQTTSQFNRDITECHSMAQAQYEVYQEQRETFTNLWTTN